MCASVKESPFAKLFSKLEEAKDRDGYTLLEHLKEMFNRILLSPKEYPLEKFEELSYLIKLTRLRLKPPLGEGEIRGLAPVVTPKQEFIGRVVSLLDSVRMSPTSP
jgi:hypothetical protein